MSTSSKKENIERDVQIIKALRGAKIKHYLPHMEPPTWNKEKSTIRLLIPFRYSHSLDSVEILMDRKSEKTEIYKATVDLTAMSLY